MFVFGILVGLPTAVLTMFVFKLLAPRILRWDPELDEAPFETESPESEVESTPEGDRDSGGGAPASPAGTKGSTLQVAQGQVKEQNLALSLAPVVVTLVLIALGALAEAAKWESSVLGFFSDPVIAMFLGATASYVLARQVRSQDEISAAVGQGLTTCGPILVLSGISGSLGAVIERSGLADVLSGAFSSGFLPPLLLVWLVAAVLHIALGSISVAAITAAGILAPIAASLGVPVVLIALAAGSGALFLLHVSSNFFWMFQTLLGLSTRGTFKTHTVAMTLSSVISLPLVLLLSVFM